MNVPTAPHPSLSALSQLLTLIQGLGLYFKAISGLNRQLYQTLTLHLGATLTTIFLWDKAVQKALERACESWRQRIFILGYPAYGADLWRTTATSRTRPPLQNTANPFCWLAFLAWAVLVKWTSHFTPSSAICIDFVEDTQVVPWQY